MGGTKTSTESKTGLTLHRSAEQSLEEVLIPSTGCRGKNWSQIGHWNLHLNDSVSRKTLGVWSLTKSEGHRTINTQ